MTNIPFEIHLTSRIVNEGNLPQFEAICKALGGKALWIELGRGICFSQPMSSIVVFQRTALDAINQAKDFCKTFEDAGFEINRIKIEIPPKFKPQLNLDAKKEHYYEWHGKIFYEKIEPILAICLKNEVHLSKNALKDSPNMRFITLREYGDEPVFQKRVNRLLTTLEKENYNIEKQQFEFCIYDNQVQLDEGWLK
jgi:hypothetical protein